MAPSDECPAKNTAITTSNNNSTSASSFSRWLDSVRKNRYEYKQQEPNILYKAPVQPSDGCPIGKERQQPASLEEAARYAQTPQPDQHIPLATERQVSSIPRTSSTAVVSDGKNESFSNGTALPGHQHDPLATNWVYPSEQQMYNAMRKKGWQNIPVESIPAVLQIHNTINERTWRLIKEWEGTDSIQLTRFIGRPKDLSPKAFIYSYILRFYDPPFDRHDWYVQDISNKYPEQRYVIDYYYLQPPQPNLPPIPYVDARPALDSPRAFYKRTIRLFEDSLPGISTYLKERKLNQVSPSNVEPNVKGKN